MPNPYEPPTDESTDEPSRETETAWNGSFTAEIGRLFAGAVLMTFLATLVLTTVVLTGYWFVSWYTSLMGI